MIVAYCAFGILTVWCIFLTVKVHQFHQEMGTFGSGIRQKFVSVDDTLDDLRRGRGKIHSRLSSLEQPAYQDDHPPLWVVTDYPRAKVVGVYRTQEAANAVVAIHPDRADLEIQEVRQV